MAFAYLILGTVWIIVSDAAVDMLITDPRLAAHAQTLKGWGFIVITALLFFYVVAKLITERRRAVELLENTRRDFLQLVEVSNEGVWILDEQGGTIFVNSRFAEMLGVSADELLRRGPGSFLPAAWREASQRAFEDRAHQSRDSYELRFQCRDGRELVLHVNGTAIFSADGQFRGCMRLLTDVTALRRTSGQLMTAYENQRSLLSELHHRVRNNLASLLSLIDLTRSRVSSKDEFAETLRGRVFALSQAYAMMTQERRSPVLLEELVRAIATPEESARLHCEGPDVSIAVDRISAMAIVMNELVALSRRFGAFGHGNGSVALKWQWAGESNGPRIQLDWIEQNAPVESDEVLRNPSARLIESLTRGDLRGEARIETSSGNLGVHLEFEVGEQEIHAELGRDFEEFAEPSSQMR